MDEERGGEGALVSGADRTPEQVEAEIEQTREELSETVEALAAKTDVKAQAKHAVQDAKSTIGEKVSGVRESVSGPAPGAAGSGLQPAPRSLSEAGGQASRLIRENRPAVIAAGAFVLGILIGRRRS